MTAIKGWTVGIVGGTGIIGASFMRELASEQVLTLGRRGFEDRRLDLNKDICSGLFAGIDLLIFAAGVRDEDQENDKALSWRLNQGQAQFIEAIRAASIKAVVNISTAHVYGALKEKITEKSTVSPQSPYGWAHVSMENRLEQLARNDGLAVLNVRPNAVYGQDMGFANLRRPQLIPYLFPRLAASSGKLTVKMPSTKRNFVSANHVAACAVKEIQQIEPGETRVLNPIGVQTKTIGEFADLVAQKTKGVLGKNIDVLKGSENQDVDFEYASNIPQRDAGLTLDEFLENYLRHLGSCGTLTYSDDKEKSNAAG